MCKHVHHTYTDKYLRRPRGNQHQKLSRWVSCIFSVSLHVILPLPNWPVFTNRCRCCSPWTWWLRLQPGVYSAMPTPTTSTPSLSTRTFRRTSPPTTSGWTCGTWRSPIVASVSSHSGLLCLGTKDLGKKGGEKYHVIQICLLRKRDTIFQS